MTRGWAGAMGQVVREGVRRRIGRVLLSGLLGALLQAAGPGAASAQGFTLIGGVAYEDGGPGPSLMTAFNAAGLDDLKPQACLSTTCPGIPHPFFFDEGIGASVMLGLRYRLEAPVSVDFRISNGPRGHAEGFDEDQRLGLYLGWATWHVATTAGLHLGPVTLRAGPVLATTGWTARRNAARESTGRTHTIGGTASVGAGLRIGDIEWTVEGGMREFPEADLLDAVQLRMAPSYGTFFIGVSAASAVR